MTESRSGCFLKSSVGLLALALAFIVLAPVGCVFLGLAATATAPHRSSFDDDLQQQLEDERAARGASADYGVPEGR